MASLAQVPDFGQASDVPERDSTSWFRLAQLEVECAETKMRVRALRAELGVEKEATEDIDAVEEQGTLCVTQTALKEMRLRYEDQCAARREAERQNAALVKQLEAASRVRNALLEESAVQSDAQAAKAEATQTALKEMCLRYEDQRAARREAERKNAALVQQLEAASPARSALLEESGVQFDAQAAKAEATAAELMGTRAQLAESNKYLRAAAEEISSSKLALESMNAKFAESQTKFQELTGEVRMVRAAIVVAFDDADQAKAEVAALQMAIQERVEELALSRAESRLAQEELASANATATQLQAQLNAGSAFAASLEESNARLQRKHEELKIRLEGLEPPPSVMTYRNVDPSLEIDLDSPPNSEAGPEPAPDPMPLLVNSAASSPETPGVIVVRRSHRPAKAPRLSVDHTCAVLYIPKMFDVTTPLPPPPAGCANWLEFYMQQGLQGFGETQILKGVGKKVYVPPVCIRCIKLRMPCLQSFKIKTMCLHCSRNGGRCGPPGPRSQVKVDNYPFDDATLQAIADFHNAAVDRWKIPGKWMGDGVPEFDTSSVTVPSRI